MMQPSAPHQGDAAIVQVPAVLGRGHLQQLEALGVGADLAGIERLADVLDEAPPCRRRTRASGRSGSWLAATRSSLRADRKRAKTASAISGSRRAHVQRALAGPLAGALLPGRVQDHVDQRLAGLLVLVGQDVAR